MNNGKLTRRILSTLMLAACPWLSTSAEEGDATEDRFAAWVVELREEALGRGITAETFDSAFSGVQALDDVIEKDRNQPEFTMTFATYRRRVVSQSRIETGRKMMAEHRELLAQIHDRFGVPPQFVVALWGIESNYGKDTGSYSIIESLATLAYDGRRSKFFRGELLDALTIIEDGHIDAPSMRGSWAGAMGQPQFMPSSFRSYAVDQDGDSKRDIWGSTADVLASAANYLARNGWNDDYIWGREVLLPDDFDPTHVGAKFRLPLTRWQALGVRRLDGSDLPQAGIDASVIQPDGPGGDAFVVYANFRVLLSWNRSDFFATSVGLISDSLMGF